MEIFFFMFFVGGYGILFFCFINIILLEMMEM